MQACSAPDGYVSLDGDCDDTDAALHPNATETCDGKDNNCDGRIDNNIQTMIWYKDNDGDGYGSPDNPIESCSQPPGYVNVNSDCDDNDPSVHPVALEICDGKDNNCNGQIDENAGVLITGMQMVMVMVTLSPALKHVLNRRDT
jgi:hypothetical protein